MAVLTGSGEIVLLTDEQGTWAEAGRIAAATSASWPVCDIAPGIDGFWFVLVSDDTRGVVIHHTDGTTDQELEIPAYREFRWDDEQGCLETSVGGDLSAVLQVHQRGPVLCLHSGEEWIHHEIPSTTWYAEMLSYVRDSFDRHHILYSQISTTSSYYDCLTAGSWTRSVPVENGPEGSHAGAPARLSLSASNAVRVIGFDYSRNVLVMWEDVNEIMGWEAEGLPIAEDILLNRYLAVTTAPDGTPYAVVARFNGASRYDLLWLSRRSASWNVHIVASGLYRWSHFNPILLAVMAAVGTEPRLVFAVLDPAGEKAILWEARPR